MSVRSAVVLICLTASAYPAFDRTAQRTRPDAEKPKRAQTQQSPQTASAQPTVVQSWMRRMTLRDRVAQLVVIHSYGEALSSRSKAYRDYVRAVRDLRVGGMVVVNRVVRGSVRSAEPHAMATFLNRMQRLARVPLLVGGDLERGASMRVTGTAKFPHLMAYGAAGDPELTRQLGRATAQEARALGVHWVFAPVADVNNNPDNPIISIRSFGEDPERVATQVKAFIEGAHSDPAARVLVTAKHFPGHGDTNVDSHMGLPSLMADRSRILGTELVPFRAAVSAGVDAVMTAHMAVPALEPEPVPATVSKSIITDLLRDDLRFKGLVVTDAMDMQGLAKQFPPGEAAVRALEAGVDVLLMPTDPEAVINAVVAAVREGRLSQQRINRSVTRVLTAKARVGLHRKKLVDVESISDVVESEDLAAQAQQVADQAVTLVRNEGNVVPLKSPDTTCLYILAESRYGQGGRRLFEEARNRQSAMRTVLLDTMMPQIEIDNAMQSMSDCSANVVAAFVSVSAYRGNVALGGKYPSLLEALQKKGAPVVLVSLGNPYLLRNFPDVSAYLATFSTTPTAEEAAVKAVLGQIPITGTMPVSIPGLAKVGDGISIAKQ